jgi:putative glycosyltransferase (TIGR04372 family)
MNELLLITYIKHKNQIRSGGLKILFKKIFKLILKSHKIIFIFLAINLFFFQRLISFFIIIRIGRLRNDRFGHITTEIENYLNEKNNFNIIYKKRTIDIFYKDEFESNKYFIKMRKRNINIFPTAIFKELFYLNFFLKQKKYICHSKKGDRDIYNLLDNTNTNLIFFKDEINEGKNFLEKLGIGDNPYVCLIVRDDAYFSYKPLSDYRNADIINFIPAINFLTLNGYYVIRMGAKVKNKLELNNNKFIDYASSSFRNEFLDIFLGANCIFSLGTSTGFEGIPVSARKPLVITNCVPIGLFPSWSEKIIAIFKHHKCEYTKKRLSLKNVINNGLLLAVNGNEYFHKGITLEENSSVEILDATIEMHEKITGKWKFQEDQKIQSEKFLELFPTEIKDRDGIKLHGKIKSQIGYQFIKRNPYFLND